MPSITTLRAPARPWRPRRGSRNRSAKRWRSSVGRPGICSGNTISRGRGGLQGQERLCLPGLGRRVVLASRGGSGTRRQPVGGGLVQLHHPAQPDAEKSPRRLRREDRQGGCAHQPEPRPQPWADLPRGLGQGTRGEDQIAGRRERRATGGGDGQRQFVLAPDRAAIVGRRRQEGRDGRLEGEGQGWRCRGDPGAVELATGLARSTRRPTSSRC